MTAAPVADCGTCGGAGHLDDEGWSPFDPLCPDCAVPTPQPARLLPAPINFTWLGDVEPEPVEWLWPGKWPRSKLVTMDGDPDVGKSTLCLDLAARVTTGRPLPGGDAATVPPSNVVLMAAEDGLADTIRPRLDAAGADPARVAHLDSVPTFDRDGTEQDPEPPTLPGDIDALEFLVERTGAVLVIVDVLMAYLGGRVDSHRDQDVRRALAQLAAMADRTGATVVLIRHVPKSQRRAGSAIAAGSGSIGIIGQARAGMVAAVDPADDTGERRILARTKGNLASQWRSLAYRLVCGTCRDRCERLDHGPAVVDWLGEVDTTGDALLSALPSDEDRSALDDAADWLTAMLGDGPMLRRDIAQAARLEGITDRTLDRASQRLRVMSSRDDSTKGRPATWSLPT